MDSPVTEAKKVLRVRLAKVLRSLDPAILGREGALAAASLEREALWREARTVFAFLSMNGEIVSDPVVEAAIGGGEVVALPRVEGDELSFRLATSIQGPWARGPFGIREPPADAPQAELDATPGPVLVIAPGVAFDEDGGRLGHGKGYYDRFLRALRSRRDDVIVAALCASCQLVDRVPMDANDERMDAVCAGGSYFLVRASS